MAKLQNIGGLGALRTMYVESRKASALACVVSGRTDNTGPATLKLRRPDGTEYQRRAMVHKNVKTGRMVGADTVVGIQRSKHSARVVGVWAESVRVHITRETA